MVDLGTDKIKKVEEKFKNAFEKVAKFRNETSKKTEEEYHKLVPRKIRNKITELAPLVEVPALATAMLVGMSSSIPTQTFELILLGSEAPALLQSFEEIEKHHKENRIPELTEKAKNKLRELTG